MSGPLQALRKLGLESPGDFALHLPLRYEDETRITRLADARVGDSVQMVATVMNCEVLLRGRRQMHVWVQDGSGDCLLRYLHFYPSQQKQFIEGARLCIRGELRLGLHGREMVHPTVRPDTGVLPATLTPVYPTVAGLPQPYLRKAIQGQLHRADLSPTVPQALAAPLPMSLADAVQLLHHPTPDIPLEPLENRSHPAWVRLKAEELLAQQISQRQARQARDVQQAWPLHAEHSPCVEGLLALLPFSLTRAQKSVGEEIFSDLQRDHPMHRLLQGDVGSGKTVVAALAAARCVDAGFQCALMVPTEILAEQHFRKLTEWMQALGVEVAWLSGTQKKKARTQALEAIAQGRARIVVGTHAVISRLVQFQCLALVIIDEQHRFGVAQRLALRNKSQESVQAQACREPHLLMMSATPIPRTLAMSYLADLDVSTIDELPPGRSPVVTRLVHERRKPQIIARIQDHIALGRQVYWVCPLIEASETVDLANATATHAMLQDMLHAGQDNGIRVGLLHSRMPAVEKQIVMDLFIKNRIQVLVSTTVIEVGVDVPNASLMVIDHAERFGLSQLHQLRGRVGRGLQASACILIYSRGEQGQLGYAAKQRLQAMLETTDGFAIARRDLEIRGPGEFLGERQAGQSLLRFANPATDTDLLQWAQHTAEIMLRDYPDQAQRHVCRWLGHKEAFLRA